MISNHDSETKFIVLKFDHPISLVHKCHQVCLHSMSATHAKAFAGATCGAAPPARGPWSSPSWEEEGQGGPQIWRPPQLFLAGARLQVFGGCSNE